MTSSLRAHFQPLDWSLLALYLLFLVIVGFWRRRQDTEDYLIANRSLSLPIFVATLVATWYGGILGAGEFVYTEGLAAWVANGLPYYIFALLFALVLARRVRTAAAHLYTIPDKLESEYDRKTALAGAVLAFIYATPAQYILMSGTLLHLLFGWPLPFAMVVGIVFSIVYVFRGGFLSDVRVNTLQFVLMFSGFLIATWLCLAHFGGLRLLTTPGRLPPAHLAWHGTHRLIWFAAWFVIALQTLTDPGFHQRCYAARTPRVAAVGIVIAVLCWMLFDALTTTTGLFSRALIPNLADGKMAFPALAERIMPAGIKGLFYVGMLAPIMASTVSYTFIAAMTVGRDFIWRLSADRDNTLIPAYTRLGLLATSLLSIAIALKVRSVVEQWYIFGNLIVSGLLIPLLGAYATEHRWKTPANFAFLSILLGTGVALFCLLYGWHDGSYDDAYAPFKLPPLVLGLSASALAYSTGLVWRRNRSGIIESNARFKGTGKSK